jgi:hypothetical protein
MVRPLPPRQKITLFKYSVSQLPEETQKCPSGPLAKPFQQISQSLESAELALSAGKLRTCTFAEVSQLNPNFQWILVEILYFSAPKYLSFWNSKVPVGAATEAVSTNSTVVVTSRARSFCWETQNMHIFVRFSTENQLSQLSPESEKHKHGETKSTTQRAPPHFGGPVRERGRSGTLKKVPVCNESAKMYCLGANVLFFFVRNRLGPAKNPAQTPDTARVFSEIQEFLLLPETQKQMWQSTKVCVSV